MYPNVMLYARHQINLLQITARMKKNKLVVTVLVLIKRNVYKQPFSVKSKKIKNLKNNKTTSNSTNKQFLYV